MIKHIKLLIAFSTVLFLTSNIFAATLFSGYAGGKITYSANDEAAKYDPDLKLQAFFAGQFNFSPDFWSHLEFSVDTSDLISDSFFEGTTSNFQIDEFSIIKRGVLNDSSNYFSVFMGTYDPIGSDIFLQRYFGITPIASKIAESWLGLAGSILYPHFGIGVSDIIRLHNSPVAFGTYMYFNHEDAKYYVFNTDLRFSCVYQYFTFDFAAGVGAPLADTYQGEDVIVAIDKLYWHAGTTILFGNNYTTGLFLQAGIFNASFTPKSKNMIMTADDVYLLVEPRFFKNNTHFNISIFSLPEDTVKNFLFIDDTLGVDLNLYTNAISYNENIWTFGAHTSVTFVDKSFMDIKNYKKITENGFNINLTPYFSRNFLSGELHGQIKIKVMNFATGKWYNAFNTAIGYKTRL